MYSDDELTETVIREQLMETGPITKQLEELSEEDKYVTLASLPGNDWTIGQVSEFAMLGNNWQDSITKVTVNIHVYRGLELRREKTYAEKVDTLVKNERNRRTTANWTEKQQKPAAPLVP